MNKCTRCLKEIEEPEVYCPQCVIEKANQPPEKNYAGGCSGMVVAFVAIIVFGVFQASEGMGTSAGNPILSLCLAVGVPIIIIGGIVCLASLIKK